MLVVLASQSPYRKAQLTAFGIPFTAQSPKVNEDDLKKTGPQDLAELTRFLALKKAESLAADYPEAIIIGSDQLAELSGERLDKPGGQEQALNQLRRMAGRTHQLITSVAVIYKGQRLVETEITRLHMRQVDDRFLKAYVALDQPYDCAGSYKIERAGLALLDRIEGTDPSAIQGLPLISLTRLFTRLGVSPDQLWSVQ